jgi:hypothetical protein
MNMNDKLHQRLILICAASFNLATSACDLEDKNIGEDGDTTGDTSGDGDGDTGDGDGDPSGDGDGDVECTPADTNVSFSYEPPDFGIPEFVNANIDTTCTVLEAPEVDGIYLELDCPDVEDRVVIEVVASPTLWNPLFIGDTVRVRYILQVTAWFDTWLELESESGELLLALVDAETMFPPAGFENQLGNYFSLGTGISTTYVGCSHSIDQCGDLERVLLGFDNDGPVPEILDGSYIEIDTLPKIDVWLETARQVEDPDAVEDPQACVDTPVGWYRMLVAGGIP